MAAFAAGLTDAPAGASSAAQPAWRRLGRTVIIAACGLAALLVGFVAFGTWRGYDAAIANGGLDTLNIARVVAAHAEQGIQSIDLNLVTTEYVMRNWPNGGAPSGAQIDWLLRGRLRLNPNVRALVMIDRTGMETHAASVRPREPWPTHAGREFFLWHRDHPSATAHVGAPVRSRADGRIYIPVSRRLTAPDGQFDGVLLATLDARFLEDFYASVDTGAHGLVAILLRDGTLLARAPRLERQVGANYARSPLFSNYLAASAQGTFREISPSDGMARLYSYAAVPGTALVVVAAFGEQDVFAAWREQALTDLAATLIFLVALAGLTWLLLRQLERQHALTDSLVEGEARYRRLLNTANEGIWKVDAGGRTVLVNPKVCAMLGCEASELMGRNPFEFLLEEDRAHGLAMTGRREAEDVAVQYDLRYRRGDGSVLHTITSVTSIYDESGAYLGALGMLTDITERARVERDLQHNLKRLEALHALDRAILAAQSREAIAAIGLHYLGELMPFWGATVMAFDDEANEAVVLGLARPDGSGYDPGPLLTLDDYGRADIALLATGRECVVEDLAALPARSRVLDALYARGMRSYVRIPLLAEGELIGAMNLGSDSAGAFPPWQVALARSFADQIAIALRQASLRGQVERQAADLERRVAERTAQFEAVNKELESFSYSVSHDLRAPVRHISGFANMLLEDAVGLDENSVGRLKRIDLAARRMNSLIDDLLALARTGTQPLHREQFEMEPLVREIIEEFAALPQAQRVEWQVGPLPPASGDPALVRVVLYNLLGNAVKYSSRRAGAQVEIGARDENGETVYFVRDNGAGFNMAHAGKLFSVFSRLHSASEFEGTGIGLATVRRIVNRHGGRVWAQAAVEQGATFYFTLGSA